MAETNETADAPSEGREMRVDTDLVRQLAELLSANELTEIEVQDGERRIVVKRTVTVAPAAFSAPPAPAPAAAPAPSAGAPPPPPAPAEENAADHPGAVKSPMVGTAYLSAEPGAKPFAAVGDKIAAGDTLLIVEAMKVMNPIPSPRAGVVKAILVQDAQPVEYDQPLAIIE